MHTKNTTHLKQLGTFRIRFQYCVVTKGPLSIIHNISTEVFTMTGYVKVMASDD